MKWVMVLRLLLIFCFWATFCLSHLTWRLATVWWPNLGTWRDLQHCCFVHFLGLLVSNVSGFGICHMSFLFQGHLLHSGQCDDILGECSSKPAYGGGNFSQHLYQLTDAFLCEDMQTLHVLSLEETQQFGLLRRFLRVHKVPENLGSRITRFLQYTYHQRESNSHDPYILDYLSKSLQAQVASLPNVDWLLNIEVVIQRVSYIFLLWFLGHLSQAELHFARYSDCLSRMKFLEQLLAFETMQEDHVMQTLAQRAVAVLDFAEDDVVFCSGCLVWDTLRAYTTHCRLILKSSVFWDVLG